MKIKNLLLLVLIGLFVLPFKVNAASLVSSINVEGIGDLNMSRNPMVYGFSTSLSYANVKATPVSENVKITGDGKVDIKEGENTITITANDGSNTETYTVVLNVTKKAGNTGTATSNSTVSYDKDGNELKNPATGAFMNIELAVIGSITLLFGAIKLNSKKKLFNRI